jgi:hypothetical protein
VPRITADQRNAMFRHLLWLHDHHFEEWLAFYKTGTASDELALLGAQDSHHAPPFTLASKRGQSLAAAMNGQMLAWKNDIPYMAWLLRGHLHAAAELDRKSKVAAHALVEVILTRAAFERRANVMLCYESIQVGIKALTGEMPGMDLIRRLLQRLDARVDGVHVQFGKRGRFGVTTVIKLRFVTHSSQIEQAAREQQGAVNDWLNEQGHWIVRVRQHETRLASSTAERKAEWAALGGSDLSAEDWIRKNTVSVGGHLEVSFPGGKSGSLILLDRVQAGPARALPGTTILTRDWQAPDLQLKKFDVPKPAPVLVRVKPRPEPWKARADRARREGRDALSELVAGLDLTVPPERVPVKPTWSQVRKQYEQQSLDRLSQRLQHKGIRW